MFKIKLSDGTFYIEGIKDRRVAYHKTAESARRFIKNHNLQGADVVDSSGRVIPESEDATAKDEPKARKPRTPHTVIKPTEKKQLFIDMDKLTPDFIEILLKEYRSLYGMTKSGVEEIYEAADGILNDNKKIFPLRDLISIELGSAYDPDKIYALIIEFMGGYFTHSKIAFSMGSFDNKTYSITEAKEILSNSDPDKIKLYAKHLLKINGYNDTSLNLTATSMQLNKFIEEPIKPTFSTKNQLTPEDITKEDLIKAAGYNGEDKLIELVKINDIPEWLLIGVSEVKKSQGFDINILELPKVVRGIGKVYENIREEQKKQLAIPIDPRIILSKDILKKIESGDLSQAQKDIIYDARMIVPQLDALTSYVSESKDYELTPIAVKLKEEGKLPLGLWERISIHKQNGTMMEIKKENLPTYQKLKFIINRIDSITNRDDKELLIKTLFEFPQYNLKSLSPQLVTLINSYFNKLSQSPISSFNKDDITKKLALLDTITLSDSEKRIVSNMRSILDADTMQKANTLTIDYILHQNVKNLPKTETLDLGKSEYSEITFITPLSSEEKLLKSISSKITLSTAPKVAHMVRELLSLREDLIEDLYNDLLSGKDTEVNEGLIYLYHKDLIPPLIYDTIKTILTRK